MNCSLSATILNEKKNFNTVRSHLFSMRFQVSDFYHLPLCQTFHFNHFFPNFIEILVIQCTDSHILKGNYLEEIC